MWCCFKGRTRKSADNTINSDLMNVRQSSSMTVDNSYNLPKTSQADKVVRFASTYEIVKNKESRAAVPTKKQQEEQQKKPIEVIFVYDKP